MRYVKPGDEAVAEVTSLLGPPRPGARVRAAVRSRHDHRVSHLAGKTPAPAPGGMRSAVLDSGA